MYTYVLYNEDTSQVEHWLKEPYKVNGIEVSPELPIVQLTVVYGTVPEYDPDTHKLLINWSRNLDNWEQIYTLAELTAQEIEQRRISNVPPQITKAQFFKACWQVLGKERDEIVAIINNIANTDTKRQRLIELQDECFIRRESQFVSFIQNHFGYTDLQVDNFFTTAKSL